MGTNGKIAGFSGGILLLAAATLNSATPLKMEVSPSVSRAPAILTVRVVVNTSPEDRTLQVVAESDTYYRSSQVQLDGANSEPVSVFEFRNLPSGTYQVTSVLADTHGPRAMASRLAKVEPTVGSF